MRSFRRSFQWWWHTCGPNAVKMALDCYGIQVPLHQLHEELGTCLDGTAWSDMVQVLRSHGLRATYGKRRSFLSVVKALKRDAVFLVGLDGDHVGLLYGARHDYVKLADPSFWKSPLTDVPLSRFLHRWDRDGIRISG